MNWKSVKHDGQPQFDGRYIVTVKYLGRRYLARATYTARKGWHIDKLSMFKIMAYMSVKPIKGVLTPYWGD